MSNSQEEKAALYGALKTFSDLEKIAYNLELLLEYKTPLALYVATADRSMCSWIFDEKTIHSMVGGEDNYAQIEKGLFPEGKNGVVFFIFNKVGPMYAMRIYTETLEEIIEDVRRNFDFS